MLLFMGESRHSVVVNVLNCNILVSEFKLQPCYYIHFHINTLGKGIIIFIPPAMG